MAYFLQIKDNSGNYRTINIKKSDYFIERQLTKTYKRAGGYKIQELDKFTMLFADEYDLKNHLLASGLLPHELENGTIVIRFIKKNGDIKNYNLLYQDDLAYFYVPNLLIEFVINKYREQDFEFLRDFAKNFYFVRECMGTAADLYNMANMAIDSGIIDRGFEELDSNGDNIVRRMVMLLIYKYNIYKGDVKYLNEFNWRTFHMLINFINNYQERTITKNEGNNLTGNNKAKAKVKKPDSSKREPDFEQLSFKDLSSNE